MKKCFWCAAFIFLFLLLVGFAGWVQFFTGIENTNNLIKKIGELNVFTFCLSAIVLFFIIIFIVVNCLINYYYNKEKAILRHGNEFYRVGNDTSKISFLDVSLFVILCAIVALVIFFIYHFWGKTVDSKTLDLTALTLSITLASIIPAIITKIIAKNEIDSLIDKRLEKHITDIKKNYVTTLKETAHSSRMVSTLLYQMAEQQKREADTLNDTDENKKKLYKQALKNIGWSIGWGTKAISQYLLIKDTYPQGINKFSKEILTDYLSESKKFIKNCTNGLTEGERKNEIRPSDLKSIFQVHALIKIHGVFTEDIELKNAKEKICVKKMLEDFEKLLTEILGRENITKARECRMTELDDDLNDELERVADEIIKKVLGNPTNPDIPAKGEGLFQCIKEWLRNHLCRK